MGAILKKDIMGLTVFFRQSSSDEAVLNHSFDSEIYFPQLPEFDFANAKSIIDIGGHIGAFSIYTSIKCPNAKIFTLEPNEESFSILKLNKEENDLTNIFIYKTAVTSKRDKVKLYLDKENWGHSTSMMISNNFEIVDSQDLISFALNHNISEIDLIKFNCEGAEFEIINSLTPEFMGRIKTMIILYHEDLTKNSRYDKGWLLNKLHKNGFFCRLYARNSKRGCIIAVHKTYKGIQLPLKKRLKLFARKIICIMRYLFQVW